MMMGSQQKIQNYFNDTKASLPLSLVMNGWDIKKLISIYIYFRLDLKFIKARIPK
jgi:hypothetical protein